MQTISTIDSIEELSDLLDNNENVLLCFSASWCPPCRAMEGTLLNTAFELDGKARVIKINPSTLPSVAKDYGVKSIPAYVSIVDGKVVNESYGVQPIDKLTLFFS